MATRPEEGVARRRLRRQRRQGRKLELHAEAHAGNAGRSCLRQWACAVSARYADWRPAPRRARRSRECDRLGQTLGDCGDCCERRNGCPDLVADLVGTEKWVSRLGLQTWSHPDLVVVKMGVQTWSCPDLVVVSDLVLPDLVAAQTGSPPRQGHPDFHVPRLLITAHTARNQPR